VLVSVKEVTREMCEKIRCLEEYVTSLLSRLSFKLHRCLSIYDDARQLNTNPPPYFKEVVDSLREEVRLLKERRLK
jgi:hypothetical protein